VAQSNCREGGAKLLQQVNTNALGQARFQIESAVPGVYRVSVLNVAKAGWAYDPSQNQQTTVTLQVPR
jgi:hypothetical protein